jgi:molecular chaperone GrpE
MSKHRADETPTNPQRATIERPLNQLARTLYEQREQQPRLLHSLAELQTLTRREVVEAERCGREAVYKELISTLDTLEDLVDAADVVVSEVVQATLAGVELARGRIVDALARLGVRRFDAPHGAPFDPALHEAVDHVHCPAVQPGCVAEQRAPGYVHGDRLLRPALVAVTAAAPQGSPASSMRADAEAGA